MAGLPGLEDIPNLLENVPVKYAKHLSQMARKMIAHPNYGQRWDEHFYSIPLNLLYFWDTNTKNIFIIPF